MPLLVSLTSTCSNQGNGGFNLNFDVNAIMQAAEVIKNTTNPQLDQVIEQSEKWGNRYDESFSSQIDGALEQSEGWRKFFTKRFLRKSDFALCMNQYEEALEKTDETLTNVDGTVSGIKELTEMLLGTDVATNFTTLKGELDSTAKNMGVNFAEGLVEGFEKGSGKWFKGRSGWFYYLLLPAGGIAVVFVTSATIGAGLATGVLIPYCAYKKWIDV